MEEILIEIEGLEGMKLEIELAILKYSAYGRWPSDDDFAAIGAMCDELKTTKAQIKTMESVRDAVISNTLSLNILV